jgi:hypothetical protein
MPRYGMPCVVPPITGATEQELQQLCKVIQAAVNCLFTTFAHSQGLHQVPEVTCTISASKILESEQRQQVRFLQFEMITPEDEQAAAVVVDAAVSDTK